MDEHDVFHTQKGYDLDSKDSMSATMEDYLEMIFRSSLQSGYVRVSSLAHILNVSSSAASKMVSKLSEAGFINFRPYGIITLTEQGKKKGSYLLRRHEVLNKFLCLLNGTASELKQAEQIEHFLTEETVYNLEKLIMKMPDLNAG